jgi:ATP-dependent Lon protease
MEVIELAGYTIKEKLSIARKYLVPRQMKEHGLKKTQFIIPNPTLEMIIDSYTREAGVRNLERTIASVCRFAAAKIAERKARKLTILPDRLAEVLGPIKFESEIAQRAGMPGVVTGLAYTPTGGEILFVETAKMSGKGMLLLTGQIGDVMKESAQTAFSVIKSSCDTLGIAAKDIAKFDFHVHVPAGAVPKDDPSAGVAIFTSLVSLMLGKPAQPEVAMTGEITLKGLVLPIGGLKEKILAAKQAGIKTVILPKRNEKDMVEVPKEAKNGMRFIFVSKAEEVLKTAIESS